MANKELGAIDCWIEGCDWWQNVPPQSNLSGDERDAIRIVHLRAQHSRAELDDEIQRRQVELGPSPWRKFIQEQIEDRNSIIYILEQTVADWH